MIQQIRRTFLQSWLWEGQITLALRYLSEDDSGEVLPLTDNAMRQLKEKHPDAQRAKLGSLLFGPVKTYLTQCTKESMESL